MSQRNAPCPCGSVRRYKECHGSLAASMPARPRDTVDFVVAGAQRSGTTALDRYLRRHPEISMGKTRKELHFFDHEEQFAGPDVDYAGYHAHFELRRPGQLRGDATPSYMYWRPAAERMARYNPALKIVIVLRNPITRAHSHWNKERQRGREALPFMAALEAETARARAALPLQDRRTSYAERGYYVDQIERLWRHFPVAQTLILRAEALQDAPAATLSRLAAFLGVAPFGPVAPESVNARTYDAPMSRDAFTFLAAAFTAEIRALEKLLGWDCTAWLEPPDAASPAAPARHAFPSTT